MDTSSSSSFPIPRLRLTRRGSSPQLVDGGAPKAPAGSSRSSPRPFIDTDDENNKEDDLPLLTLKPLSSSTSSGSYHQGQRDIHGDTPAARLRALLSRVPNESPSKAPDKASPPPTDLESDIDPPHFSPTTPSVARESLKDIFSRAMRDPGDTPKKGARRRNSIDVSEVESSPRARKERARHKAKRRSLSDEEADNPSMSK
jgi:hypothetical protein